MYKLNEGFITQKIGKKTTIFSSEHSQLITLNETASLIFQGVKLGWDKQKIIQVLARDYNVNDKEAEIDVDKFIELLESKQIIYSK